MSVERKISGSSILEVGELSKLSRGAGSGSRYGSSANRTAHVHLVGSGSRSGQSCNAGSRHWNHDRRFKGSPRIRLFGSESRSRKH